MSELKRTLIKGTIWSTLGRMASLIIILFTNIWLARLLNPGEFGQIGVVMFFVTIANVLTEGGLGGALVRKKNATLNDYSTVFVTNLVFSVICYLLILTTAGMIASYYEDPLLENLLIVASFILIINSFQITQNAKLMSDMKFKNYSIYTFSSVFLASVIGVFFAYNGIGVWALIIIQLLTALFQTILLWIFEGFFLRFYFSKSSFKELYSFGINTSLASILNSAFENIYQLVLARYFSFQETGYFYQAKKLQDVPGGILTMLTQGVFFSSLAKLQDDKMVFAKVYNKIALYFMVFLGIISTFIYIYSKPIIILLYGEKWIGSVFYLQLLTIASFFYLLEKINRIIFKVFDQTRKILYLEYLKKTIQMVSVFIGVYYLDLYILIFGFVLTNGVSYFINYYYSHKTIDSVSLSGIFDLVKVVIVSTATIVITLGCSTIFEFSGFEIFYSLPLFLISYVLLIDIFKILYIKKEIAHLFALFKNKL